MNIREFDTVQQRYVKVPEIPAQQIRNPVRHQYFEILRKAKFYLRIQPSFDRHMDQGNEVDEGDVRQPFCRIFRSTWLALATKSYRNFRNDMLSYWAQAGEQLGPRLTLDFGCFLIGGYGQPTRSFTFNIECVELALQDGQLANLIAHELGHAWHDTQPNSNIRTQGSATNGSEVEANDIATQWGYDMMALDEWRDEKQEQIAIYTGQKPRPVPAFDPSVFEGTW